MPRAVPEGEYLGVLKVQQSARVAHSYLLDPRAHCHPSRHLPDLAHELGCLLFHAALL